MKDSQPHIYLKENLKSDRQMVETVSKKIDRHEKAKRKFNSTFQFIYAFGIVGINIGVAVFIMVKIQFVILPKFCIDTLHKI